MKILYLDCPSGISGNMALGALMEVLNGLGVDAEAYLRSEIDKLHVGGYRLDIEKRASHEITGTHVNVVVDGKDEYGHVHHLHEEEHVHSHTHDGHEHTHVHTHDGEHAHTHEHSHDGHEHTHTHEHSHDGEHAHEHSHDHVHRNYYDIKALIDGSEISEGAKELANRIFLTVAEAESKVHGRSLEEVHFHEVGAIDSIIDIVGTAILVDKISPDRVFASVVNEGTGFINCAHGKMSVPVPATTEIFRTKQIKFRQTEVPTELVTPTGAAIVGTLAEEYGGIPEMTMVTDGYGLGTKDIGYANALKVYLGEAQDEEAVQITPDDIIVIETNIDDSTGEDMGFALERLMEAGARDAFFTPIFMKKNRPAYMLSVICRESQMAELMEIIFRETTSIGARYYKVERTELKREFVEVETKYGTITGKKVMTPKGCVYVYPEYEDMKKAALDCGASLKDVRTDFHKSI